MIDRQIVGARRCCAGTTRELGEVTPRVFIPLAEESGLIHALGEWVVRRAARRVPPGAARRPRPLVVSINLSARQFYREDLARRIADIVRDEAACRSGGWSSK
ncbi:MAG: EAL domain-containing protein [Betaproteobacteria bacterium]|nr:EAL domain-containing protein [Betaproteobacteria bacterium]